MLSPAHSIHQTTKVNKLVCTKLTRGFTKEVGRNENGYPPTLLTSPSHLPILDFSAVEDHLHRQLLLPHQFACNTMLSISSTTGFHLRDFSTQQINCK